MTEIKALPGAEGGRTVAMLRVDLRYVCDSDPMILIIKNTQDLQKILMVL